MMAHASPKTGPDPSACAYLSFTALMMAMIDGIQNKIDPGEPLDKDIYDLPPEELKNVPSLPGSLEESLKALEVEFGRQPRNMLNEPRPLDLDLIALRQETRHSERLTLPHPRAHLRRFVLQPMAEVAPDLVLPGQILSIRQLLETLDSSERLLRLG